MRSFSLTALAFLTLGAYSAAAPVHSGSDSGDVSVDVGVDVGVGITLKRDAVKVDVGDVKVDVGGGGVSVVVGDAVDVNVGGTDKDDASKRDVYVDVDGKVVVKVDGGVDVAVSKRDDVKVDVGGVVKVDVEDGDSDSVKVAVGKRGSSPTLDSILEDFISDIDAITAEIAALDSAHCTTAILTPILEKVEGIIQTTADSVKGLNGVYGILGLLDLDAVVKIIVDVLCAVLKLVQLVLGLVSVVVKADLLPLLCDILNLLGELLSCILDVVVPLLDVAVSVVVHLVVGLIDKALLQIIIDLKAAVLIQVLGL